MGGRYTTPKRASTEHPIYRKQPPQGGQQAAVCLDFLSLLTNFRGQCPGPGDRESHDVLFGRANLLAQA